MSLLCKTRTRQIMGCGFVNRHNNIPPNWVDNPRRRNTAQEVSFNAVIRWQRETRDSGMLPFSSAKALAT